MSGNYFDRFDEQPAPKTAPKKGGGNYFDRYDEKPAKKPSMAGDFARPVVAAWDKLTGDIKADYDKAQRVVRGKEDPNVLDLGPGAKLVGNALTLAASPLTGATEAVVSRPAARAAIGAGLPVYERRNALTIPTEAPKRVYGQEAEDIVAGDVNLALAGSRSAPTRAPRAVPAPRPAATPVERAGVRARLDPPAMRARAAELRRAGVEPTLTDVSGGRGQRMIRAVGVRGEEAGEELTRRAARASSDAKPAAMDATRRLTPDTRTPTQYADAMEATRTADARRNYGQFDHQPVQVPETVIDALSDGPGRAIIARARREAAENQDWPRLAELDALAQHRPGDPLPRVTAGTLDKLSGAARNRGAAFAARPGGGTMARGAMGRRDQIDATLDGVTELRPTRETFANQSRAIDVARGENYMDPLTTNPTDYASWLQGLPTEARRANQIAIRQQILDKLGKQRANSLGSLDDLTTAQYSRENLRAVFGQQQGDAYLAHIDARVQQARNASFVQPNAGSRTAVLDNDVGNAAQQTVGAVRQGLSGDALGLAARAVDAWRRRGFTPQEAEELARIATDPAQTDAAIEAIAGRLAAPARMEFITLRRAVRALGGGSRPAAAGATGANLLAPPRESQTNALTGR